MGLYEKQNLVFYYEKLANGGLYPMCKSNTSQYNLSSYLHYLDWETLDEVINMLDLAIKGKFYEIEKEDDCEPKNVRDISTDFDFLNITPLKIEHYSSKESRLFGTYTHSEFKELLIKWRDFVNESHV